MHLEFEIEEKRERVRSAARSPSTGTRHMRQGIREMLIAEDGNTDNAGEGKRAEAAARISRARPGRLKVRVLRACVQAHPVS